MRIAIITSVHPPLDGRIFHKQATSLAQAGHAVTLIAPFQPDAERLIRERGIEYVPLERVTTRWGRPKVWRQLIQTLRHRRSDFDVWHFHDPELLPLAIMSRDLFARGARLIYDVHEDVPKDILSKGWIPSFSRPTVSRSFDRLERWGMRRCDLVIAATDSIAVRVARNTQHSITVRNYPLLRDAPAKDFTRPDATEVRAIYVGNLTEPRGIRETVLAMSELGDCPVKLTLLGQLYPEDFKRQIQELAGPNVEIHAPVPFQEVPAFLDRSDIGIVCLKPGPNHLEAMPTKLFEYMQAGLPVIASNFPMWTRIVEDAQCGLVVDPTRPSAIAQAIRELARDAALRQRMGLAGIKAVQQEYSWKSQSCAMLEAYPAPSRGNAA